MNRSPIQLANDLEAFADTLQEAARALRDLSQQSHDISQQRYVETLQALPEPVRSRMIEGVFLSAALKITGSSKL